MPLWKIAPAAEPGDPRWQDHAIWREVVVRADTAASARLVATRLERDPEIEPSGNESLSFRSAFVDDKLYWVSQLEESQAAPGEDQGPEEILRATRWDESGT